MARIGPALLVTFLLVAPAGSSGAQQDLSKRVDELAKRVEQLEAQQPQPITQVHRDAGGAALFLFGAFCALWAQNTNRNPWLWFFLGLFFNVITVLVLLSKNSDDRRLARGEPVASGSRVAIVIVASLLIVVALAAFLFWAWTPGAVR